MEEEEDSAEAGGRGFWRQSEWRRHKAAILRFHLYFFLVSPRGPSATGRVARVPRGSCFRGERPFPFTRSSARRQDNCCQAPTLLIFHPAPSEGGRGSSRVEIA